MTVDYYDSVAICGVEARQGEARRAGASAGMERAKPGEKPGGAAAADVTIVGTVAEIAPRQDLRDAQDRAMAASRSSR